MITSEYPGVKRPHGVPFIPRQIKALRNAGVDVDLFHFNGRKKLINYMKAWRQLRKHTAGKTYDLVHAQWGQSAVLALPKKLPWVITFRGNDLEGIVGPKGKYTIDGRIQMAISKMMARLAEQVIVVSESLGRKLARKDYHVIPSGLDLELFKPGSKEAARQLLGLPQGKHLVLFAARRSVARKRFALANAAVNLLKDRMDVEIVTAEKIPHNSVPDYMNACDALLLTSMHEGSPNVVKEALACNLAVVATDVGDVSARIEDVEGCVVCREETPEAISLQLETVLKRPGRINGRDAVLDLDEANIAAKVIQVYRKTIKTAAAGKNAVNVIAQGSPSRSS
jgi:glycosyltransferase involved in cell wall biosynthesis